MLANFIDGPLWYFSLVVFVVGVLWKLGSIVLGQRPTDLSIARESASSGALKTVFSRFIPEKGTVSHIKLHVVAGYLFHLGLFALIFFAAPHVKFFEEHLLGFGWIAMPHWAFIVAAQFAFMGLLLLWLNRVMNKVSRLISTWDDHIASILTFVVMLTGCFALIESFESLRLLHRFSVELFLIYFPFSQLMHAFTFAMSRWYNGAISGYRGVQS